MAVTIGHASGTEYGDTGWNGNAKAGDQTGREVCKRSWYSYPWTAVIRPKDPAVAEKIAKCCEQGAANNNIGYDQSQRETLYEQAERVGFNLSKITKKCETDCSAFVAVCVNAAGIRVSSGMYTGNELATLRSTGKFTIYTSADYTARSDKLKRGDILLGSGHTAMVLTNGSNAAMNTPSSSGTTLNRSVQRTVTITNCGALNVREWAGKRNKPVSFSPLKSGTKVGICDEIKADDGSMWYYIKYKGHYGFIAARSSADGKPYVI